jgi:hypothetical protein
MNHLFANAATAKVGEIRTNGQIAVVKFTPNTENLDAFGLVRFNQKIVEH